MTVERKRVELRPHSPAWALMARDESARIAAVLGTVVLRTHHVGSTSIPGIRAKPVIDLLPEVASLDALDAARGRLEALGYEWRGEFGIDLRRYCTLDDHETGERRVQLHCFATGHPEITRMLTFRDYLRAHPHEARAYEDEKERCRVIHADNTMSYAEAKTEWIRSCDVRAAAWRSAVGR